MRRLCIPKRQDHPPHRARKTEQLSADTAEPQSVLHDPAIRLPDLLVRPLNVPVLAIELIAHGLAKRVQRARTATNRLPIAPLASGHST